MCGYTQSASFTLFPVYMKEVWKVGNVHCTEVVHVCILILISTHLFSVYFVFVLFSTGGSQILEKYEICQEAQQKEPQAKQGIDSSYNIA